MKGQFATTPLVPRLAFNTDDFKPADRLSLWRENVGVIFDLSAPDGSKQPADLHGKIDACHLAGTVFGVTTSQAQRFTRSSQRIARDGMEHFLVQVFLRGGGRTRDGQIIKAGDMVIIDLDQPHEMLNTDFSNLSLVLPRETNPALSELMSRLHAKRLSQRAPMVRFLAGHLKALWNSASEMNVLEAGIALSGTIGLMEGWLSQDGRLEEELSPAVSSALAKSIFRYVEGHLDEDITPDHLAARFRMSRTQLYRIFKSFGGVSHYLWERRINRSMRMLSDPAFADMNIATIAFKSGYTSEAHFSRSFKARFGMNPSQFRRECLEALFLREHDGVDEADSGLRFAQWILDL